MAEAQIIDILFGLLFLGLGWWMRTLNESIRALHDSDRLIIDRVQHIEVLVAGKYITREEANAQYMALVNKLDTIDQKLSSKLEQKADR